MTHLRIRSKPQGSTARSPGSRSVCFPESRRRVEKALLAGAERAPIDRPARFPFPRRLAALATLLPVAAMAACTPPNPPEAARTAMSSPASAEVRAIARDAYIYGFPLVDNYRILYTKAFAASGSEPPTPFNQIQNTARVNTPDDKTVQTPNSDTPYSNLTMDLRAEPLVVAVPRGDEGRYFSLQFIDLYTHNYAYVGTRATGNDGGAFLVTGPGWKGEKPKGVVAVIPTETELAKITFRTQLFGPDDMNNVQRVQAGYEIRPLSAFLGTPAPPPAPSVPFVEALSPAGQRTSLEFFEILNFVLQFCPTHPSEIELMARFASIGIGAGRTFDPAALSPDVRKAFEEGMADAWASLAELQKRIDAKEVLAGDLFGTREFLKNNYLYRMAGAVLGIYGNSREEAMYPMYFVDADGKALDASGHDYTLRFVPGQLPPVDAFWSLTLYELPSSLLTANPIDRYLINSPMLPRLEKDADGGLTLWIQHESPGKSRTANWLPAPDGPFFLALRLYLPKPEATSGAWKEPPLERVN